MPLEKSVQPPQVRFLKFVNNLSHISLCSVKDQEIIVNVGGSAVASLKKIPKNGINFS